jgi:predicted nucleic acid-binding protein
MIVMDSSVALKWIFAEEEGSTQALLLRDSHAAGKLVLAVPVLFFYEIANVLATKVSLSEEQAQLAFALYSDFDLDVHDLDQNDFRSAIALSHRYRISVYDATYHILAQRLGARRCFEWVAQRRAVTQ